MTNENFILSSVVNEGFCFYGLPKVRCRVGLSPSLTTQRNFGHFRLEDDMNVAKPGIYQIVNLDNGKRYIGSASRIHWRFSKHKRQLRTGTHYNRYLQRAWNNHGEKRFLFDVIEICPKDKLRECEQMWLDLSRCTEPQYGYNSATNAERPNEGRKWTNAQREKIRIMWTKKHPYNYGKSPSKEIRKHISEGVHASVRDFSKKADWQRINYVGSGNPMYGKAGFGGKKHSEETKQKMSVAGMGHKCSDETRKKIGNANRGKVRTKDMKKKMSIAHLKGYSNSIPC